MTNEWSMEMMRESRNFWRAIRQMDFWGQVVEGPGIVDLGDKGYSAGASRDYFQKIIKGWDLVDTWRRNWFRLKGTRELRQISHITGNKMRKDNVNYLNFSTLS